MVMYMRDRKFYSLLFLLSADRNHSESICSVAMDFSWNVSFTGEIFPPCSSLMTCFLEVDVDLEWLSIFVEDCLSSKGDYLPPPTTTTLKPLQLQKPQQNSFSLHKFTVPNKPRSKRKRTLTTKTKNPSNSWAHHLNPKNQALYLASSDWLAESELIVTKKETSIKKDCEQEDKNCSGSLGRRTGQQQRRCTHCQSQRTPQWRAGPLGPKTLCNACGVRYKSGRLVPEYRPAKSPTFVSYLHSNSHKKVMQMRMDVVSSVPNDQCL